MIFTGSGNANKISGIPVASGTPTDTQTLNYDLANNKWVYATNGIPSGGAVGGASAVATNRILYGASAGVATSTSTFVNTATGVGMGTASPVSKVHVSVAANDGITVSDTTNTLKGVFYNTGGTAIGIGTTTNHPVVLYTNNAPRVYITETGNVGIGGSPSYQFQLSTDSAAKPSTNTWTIVSDSRLKTVKGEYSKGLAEICQVRPVRYEYNGKGGMVVDGKEQISIIAQELMEVFPECVSTFNGKLNETDTEETEMYNYNGHAITFALINAVKELKAEIDVLKAR